MTATTTSGVSTPSPSNILTTTQYAAQQATAATSKNAAMGQGAFLTLFTTQLQNQDPTNPVQNQDFVAQLAQFSQLEALQSMQTSMNNLVTSMGSDRLLGAASLMGKSVSVPNGPVVVSNGSISQGTITLPAGADGVQLQVFDSSGNLVRTMVMGAQPPGNALLSWDGNDDAGNPVPNGNYRFVAKANSSGTTSTPTVSTFAQVTGVSSSGTSDGSYLLQVAGGQSIPLSSVTQISQ